MDQQKSEFIEQLKSYPNIQMVCEKLKIPRSTFYRWRGEDNVFRKDLERAIREGCEVMHDIVESKFMALIQEKKWPPIKYYFDKKHPKYNRPDPNDIDMNKLSVLELVEMADDPDDEDEDD